LLVRQVWLVRLVWFDRRLVHASVPLAGRAGLAAVLRAEPARWYGRSGWSGLVACWRT